MNVIAVFSIAAAILIVAGIYFSRKVFDPGRMGYEEALAMEVEKGTFDLHANGILEQESYTVESPQGYQLACGKFSSPAEIAATKRIEQRRAIVLAHGHSFNRAGSLKYVPLFLNLGYEVIVYDHRACGDSGGRFTTMGVREADDLGAVIADVRRRLGDGCFIGLHGESMGAATAILRAAVDQSLGFVIADCSFSDLHKLLAIRIKATYHLPPFPLLNIAEIASRLIAGFSFRQASPVNALRKADGAPQVPMLFIHGEADDYVPASMALELQAAKKGIAELYLVKGAAHALSYTTDRETYAARVGEFLKTVSIRNETS